MVANLSTAVIYPKISTLENVVTAENCNSIFISMAPGANSGGWAQTLDLRMTKQVFYYRATTRTAFT